MTRAMEQDELGEHAARLAARPAFPGALREYTVSSFGSSWSKRHGLHGRRRALCRSQPAVSQASRRSFIDVLACVAGPIARSRAMKTVVRLLGLGARAS